MTTRNITDIECSRFGTFGIHTIYLLSLCLVLCIILLIRRSQLRAAAPDAEIGISYPKLNGTTIEMPSSDFGHTQVAAQKMHSVGYLDPFADAGCVISRPFTSGFLAAKADIDNAGKAAEVEKEKLKAILEPQGPSFNPLGTAEDQQVPWRRHSYPSDQDQSGGLRGDSLHDNTEHFCDNHDSAVIWRRRTMIFHDKP